MAVRVQVGRNPFLPGYPFCRVQIPSVQWMEGRSLPGIAYVLNAEGAPLPVPDDLVEWLKTRVELQNRTRSRGQLGPGHRVTIAHVRLRGPEAAFDRRLSASGRSRVLVSRLVPGEIHETDLSTAE